MGNYVKRFEAFSVNESNETAINEGKAKMVKLQSGEELSADFAVEFAKAMKLLDEQVNESMSLLALLGIGKAAWWALSGMVTLGVIGKVIKDADKAYMAEQDEAAKKKIVDDAVRATRAAQKK
jgi:hypothetical protein